MLWLVVCARVTNMFMPYVRSSGIIMMLQHEADALRVWRDARPFLFVFFRQLCLTFIAVILCVYKSTSCRASQLLQQQTRVMIAITLPDPTPHTSTQHFSGLLSLYFSGLVCHICQHQLESGV